MTAEWAPTNKHICLDLWTKQNQQNYLTWICSARGLFACWRCSPCPFYSTLLKKTHFDLRNIIIYLRFVPMTEACRGCTWNTNKKKGEWVQRSWLFVCETKGQLQKGNSLVKPGRGGIPSDGKKKKPNRWQNSKTAHIKAAERLGQQTQCLCKKEDHTNCIYSFDPWSKISPI